MSVISLLLVDDHKMIRDGLKIYFENENKYEVVAEAENGKKALDLLKDHPVDIVVTDIVMPEMDGITLTKSIKENNPKQKILALTMLNESQHIKQMLNNGVSGYLLKNCGAEEIKKAIDIIHSGETYYAKEVTEAIMDNLRKVKKPKSNVTLEMPLTEREKEVLYLIIKENSNKEIADQLGITESTSRSNLVKARHKLKAILAVKFIEYGE